MKRLIKLSLASVLAIASLQAAEVSKDANDLESMFANGKVSGQIRTFYIDRAYQGSAGKDTHRDSTAIGGHIKYETATYNAIKLGAAFYTTHKVDLNQHGTEDPSLLGLDWDSYSILGEAYLGLDFSEYGSKTNAKLGLQRYDTPMVGSDDARMIPNTFEAYKIVNRDIGGLTIQVAHINQIAYGSFGNIYMSKASGTVKGGGLLGATAGYSANGIEVGEYNNIGDATVGENTDGITNMQLSYKNGNFNAKVSDDYAWDLYNTIYADAGVSWTCLLTDSVKPFFKAQVIKQDSVGDENMQNIDTKVGSSSTSDGDINSLYWAIKAGAKAGGLTAYVAYSETTDNDKSDINNGNAYSNAIISQFGGMPAYTQGMVTRHMFLAGTKATKVAASYSFKEQGLNLSAAAYYASFDMDDNSGYGPGRTAYEPGFDIKYYPKMVKNLQLRVRGNFPRKFAETSTGKDVGWDEYRFIVNYNF